MKTGMQVMKVWFRVPVVWDDIFVYVTKYLKAVVTLNLRFSVGCDRRKFIDCARLWLTPEELRAYVWLMLRR